MIRFLLDRGSDWTDAGRPRRCGRPRPPQDVGAARGLARRRPLWIEEPGSEACPGADLDGMGVPELLGREPASDQTGYPKRLAELMLTALWAWRV